MTCANTVAHTPGPWHADWTTRHGYKESGYAGWHVHNNDAGEPVICEIPDDERHDGSRAANAKLIAAAPDLLHACKLAMAFGSQGDTHEGLSVSEFLRAAVAKAEGEVTP